MEIVRGARLEVETANGDHVVMRALGRPGRGRDVVVVWVCTEDEFKSAEIEGEQPHGIPWPLSAVRLLNDPEPAR